jgi:hypothetical protein
MANSEACIVQIIQFVKNEIKILYDESLSGAAGAGVPDLINPFR